MDTMIMMAAVTVNHHSDFGGGRVSQYSGQGAAVILPAKVKHDLGIVSINTFRSGISFADPVDAALRRPFDYDARPIWEEIEQISNSIPDDAWDDHDHNRPR